MDNNLSLEIYDFLVKFNMNSGIIDDSYMEKLKKILQKKKKYIIILQPSINDILEDKIYKLEYKENFYYGMRNCISRRICREIFFREIL